MDVFALHNTTETMNIGANTGFQVNRRVSNEVALQISNSNIPLNVSNFPALPGISECNSSYKRKKSETDTSDSDCDTEYFRAKKQKVSNTSKLKYKKGNLKKKYNFRRITKIQWNEVNKETLIIDMTRRLLELDQDLDYVQYDIFMKHTLTLIIDKTNEAETVILSIKLFDYEHVQEIRGRYNHVTYVLDTEDKIIHLSTIEWDCLKLYAEKARKQVVRRLKLGKSSQYIQSMYLFIKFDGHPFVKEVNKLYWLLFSF